jgi:predicted lipid-binding transport protein (Tim44 family)
MNSAFIQLLVLGGIALFLVIRLKNVLGTRTGFEKPPVTNDVDPDPASKRRDFEVIEGGIDHDIADHIDINSVSGKALASMKSAEHDFGVTDFLNGARGAYEMILMAFQNGELAPIKQFLSDEVYTSFLDVIETRSANAVHIDATFIGVRELKLTAAEFDDNTKDGEITIKFVAEMTSVVRDRAGEIVEGNPEEIKRQKDIWTFARIMGSDDPNWKLVATGG